MYKNLISTDYLIKISLIDESTDPRLLLGSIRDAQSIDLQQCIGGAMYDYILNNVNDNGTVTLNDDYKYLMREYIMPAIARFAFYYAIPDLNYKFTNKAVAQKNSDFSNSTDLESIKYLSYNSKDKAQYYMQRVKEYICKHIDKFPEYNMDSENGIEPKRKSQYSSGIYLGGYKNRCGCGSGGGCGC